MDPQINIKLRTVGHRLRRLRMARLWTASIGTLAIGFAVIRLLGISFRSDSFTGIGVVAVSAGLCGLGAWLASRFSYRDDRKIARLVEAACPDLRERLLASLDQSPNAAGEWSYLQKRLTADVLKHHAQDRWATRILPDGQMRGARSGVLFALHVLCFLGLAPLTSEKNVADSSG